MSNLANTKKINYIVRSPINYFTVSGKKKCSEILVKKLILVNNKKVKKQLSYNFFFKSCKNNKVFNLFSSKSDEQIAKKTPHKGGEEKNVIIVKSPHKT